MKGYYSLEIQRSYQKGCGFRYKLVCHQHIFDEVDTEKLKYLCELPREQLPEVLHWASATSFLNQCNMKTKQLFEIRCHYPTAYRILYGLQDSLPKQKLRTGWNSWQNPIEVNAQAEQFLSFEEFLAALQKSLNELPPKTFSKENRQKAIESYMASV